MAETEASAYAVTAENAAADTPNKIAVVIDADNNLRQIVGLGALDGTGTIVDGTPANPLSVAGFPDIQAVDGTVTANAGTNLNTSTLALETGGNLAEIATKIPNQGNAVMVDSVPVTIASDQSSVTVDTDNQTFKDDFAGTSLSAAWTVTQGPGTNTSYNVAGSLLS